MELPGDMSYIQLFWTCLLGLELLAFLYVLLGGSYLENLKTDTPSDEQKLGWLRFRRRSSQYYFVGAVFTGFLLWTEVSAYCWGREPNSRLQHLIDTVTVPSPKNSNAGSTILATSLLFVHLLRHVYECIRIRIFSRRSTLNIFEVVMSYIHYIAVALTLVAEGPAFSKEQSCFNIYSLNISDLAGIGLFLFGSVLQYRCSLILAKLRRNKAGHIVTSNYRIPKGGWFDVISCPHYLAEILIFTGIGLVSGTRYSSVCLMFASIFTTHMFLAVNSQNFYLKKFGSDYPKERRRLIPYIF